jgi:gliding motility-associated-like protein
MEVAAGNNYTVSGSTITPSPDFAGSIFASVTVDDGKRTSAPFNFQITVRPVNDASVIALNDPDSLRIQPGSKPTALFQDVDISDVDNDSLSLAEVSFDENTYSSGADMLLFTNTPEIKGVFDSQNGILALIGKGSVDQYIVALQSIQIQLASSGESGSDVPQNKSIYLLVNDGQDNSNRVAKTIATTEQSAISLEIPTGFTPNGDAVNDTWSIRPLKPENDYQEAIVRVYTKSGLLVFEANGLHREWDGRYNGVVLPADVYFYTIDLNIPDTLPSLKGIVTILR